MNPTLYIDVDGVLNAYHDPTAKPGELDIGKMKMLRSLQQKTDCHIVTISAAWGADMLQPQFDRVEGLTLHREIYTGGKDRAREVKIDVLTRGIDRWCIIDDEDPDDDYMVYHGPNFVRTNSRIGLVTRDVVAVADILVTPSSESPNQLRSMLSSAWSRIRSQEAMIRRYERQLMDKEKA